MWESYQFLYALRDAGVTIAGGWHSPLEKGILDALIEGKVNVTKINSTEGPRLCNELLTAISDVLLSPFLNKKELEKT